MSDVKVVPVSSKGERKQFLNLPWALYREDPHWIPPLRRNQAELCGFHNHPFYHYAEIQTFIAYHQGQPAGRIAAIVNPAHNERYDEQLGFFGFFECIDRQDVATSLFEAARDWFSDRDITRIRGPINPSLNYECGLLIDGFDSPPTFMMTYNPPYYAELIENAGFAKVEDLFAFWGHVEMLEKLDKKLAFIREESQRRFNVTLRNIDKSNFLNEVRMFLDIYNQSLAGTWGFTPLSPKEIDHLSGSLRHLIVPEITSVAEVDGKPVAASFALLDYNPRIKKIDGRLLPFGFAKLLWNRKKIKRIRVISSNVVPAYQKWGLGLVVLSHLVPGVLEWGIEEAEFSWVLESNKLSYGSLKRGGAKIIKQYRIYDSVD